MSGKRISPFALGTLIFLSGLGAHRATADDLRRRGMMGVQLAPIHDDVKEKLKLESTKGVVVSSVVPDSAAAAAGVKPEDVIRKIGSDPIDDLPALFAAMRKYYGGDVLKLTVIREGAETTLELTLKPRAMETSDEFDILYESAGDPGQRVRTLVTKPKSEGKKPAVLLVTGISPQSIEMAFPGLHPIKVLVQELNKAGYVTMRVDRLGVGDSEGTDPQATTVAADIASFRAALAKLRGYDFVDADKVFLLGHSMGTNLLPVVAKDQKLAGVLTFGAAFRPWTESVIEAMQRRWKFELIPEDQMKSKADALKTFLNQYVTQKQNPADILAKSPELGEALGEGIIERGFVLGMPPKYGQELAELPIGGAWSAISVPVLVIWGEADFVASRADSEQLADAVNKGNPGKAQFMPLPQVDHSMSKASDQEESFLAGMGTFNPKFIEAITKWMAGRTGKGT